MKRIAYIVFLVFSFGCAHTLSPSVVKTQKDSVSVLTTVQWHDTTVIAKADSIEASWQLPVFWQSGVGNQQAAKNDSVPFTKEAKGGHSIVSFTILHDTIWARCFCDSVELKLKIAETTIEYYKSIQESDQTTITKLVKKIPGGVKTLAWIGGIVCLLIIGYIIYKLKV